MSLPESDELQIILDDLETKGISYSDLRIDQTSLVSILVRNKEIRSLKSSLETGFGLRILLDGSWGFTSAMDLDSLKNQIPTLISLTKNSASHNTSFIKIEELSSVTEDIVWKPETPHSSKDIEEKIEFVIEANKRPLDADTSISSMTTSYSEREQTRQFVSSEKRQIKYSYNRTNFSAYYVGQKNDVIVERSRSMGGIGGLEVTPFDDILTVIDDETKTVIKLLDAKAAPSGSYPTVLNYQLSYTLAHEAFGHLCEGDSIIQGDSILEGRLETKVASDIVTILDDPTQTEPSGRPAFGSFPYDDEGVKAQPTTLVDKGILKSYMHNRESAFKLNQPLTGNGRAESAKRRPQVRMTNTYFKPGTASQEELLEDIKDGIYLVDARGGQTTGQGTYHVGVQLAYKIEKGELGELYRGTGIGGRTLDTLMQIDMVGKQMGFGIGACGKGDPTQTVYCGDNCPEIRLSKLTIGG